MSVTKSKLVWNTVSVEKMPKEMQPLYAEFRAQADKANKAREKFQNAFIANATASKKLNAATHKLVFGYKFGRLAVAIAPLSIEDKDDGSSWEF